MVDGSVFIVFPLILLDLFVGPFEIGVGLRIRIRVGVGGGVIDSKDGRLVGVCFSNLMPITGI